MSQENQQARQQTIIRGRYAPSPTGDLHLGNLRTALLAWFFARIFGGQFILRIEDLDQPRVRPGATKGMLEDLRWLGLDWDEGPDQPGPYGPYTQSERLEIYETYLQQLQEAGLVYPCYCSRAEIAQAASAPQQGAEQSARYPGVCRHLTTAQRRRHKANGRRPSLRFHVDDERIVTFTDRLQGPQQQQVQQYVGDFIIRRSDGIFAYQFAVVIDDALMHINQIVRGMDLLTSSARQILLFEALHFTIPDFIHVPLLLDEQGQRMAKRQQSMGLVPRQASGMTPEEVIGQLGGSCGLVPTGITISPNELVHQYQSSTYDIMRQKIHC